MAGNYVLDGDGNPALEPDIHKWGKWFENAKRQVNVTQIGDRRVSTVFLGIDHNFSGSGPPILFETMVFAGDDDEDMDRYSTRDEALAGHDAMCDKVRKAER